MSETLSLAERHVRAFNNRAWDEAPELYAPDLSVAEPGGTSHGIAPFLGHAQGFVTAFPDSRMEVSRTVESGGVVVIEGIYTGTHTGPMGTPQGEIPATGRELALPICDVIEVAAGRISSINVYYDQMAFAAQLGLMPDGAPAG